MPTLKPQIQTMLKRVDLHQRLKASSLYDLYWTVVDKPRLDRRRNEVDFYRTLLTGFRPGDLIFDVGANDGEKSDIFLRLGARVVAVEPDEANQEIMKGKFEKFRLSPKPVTIVGKAVSDKDAIETMWIDGDGSALNTLSPKWVDTLKSDKKRFEHTNGVLEFARHKKIQTTTLEHLMDKYGVPYYIKIDVEGYEPMVIKGLKRSVPFLSFEVNLPEFRPEGLECVELLGNLAPDGKFNYVMDCQKGVCLDRWMDAQEFSKVFSNCSEPCVEVLWRTSASAKR